MARQLIDFGTAPIGSTYANDEAGHEVELLRVRNLLRTALDGDGLHTNWMVGDIAKWTGASTYSGYAFGIYHMNAGTPTGPVWVIFFPGFYASGLVDIDDVLQAAKVGDYFRDWDGNALAANNGPPAMHYCETGGYDFGYDADGALTGGDFDTPTTNPYTNLDGFMPSTGLLYGILTSDSLLYGTYYRKWAILADDTKPFLSLHIAAGQQNFVGWLFIAGEIVDPYEAGDTSTSATSSWTVSHSTTQQAYSTGERTYVYDDLSARTEVAVGEHTSFLSAYPDGSYAWAKVILASTSYFKGHFDFDVIRSLGSYNGDTQEIFDDGSLVFWKGHKNLAFPWITGIPVYPYIEVP